MWRPSGLWTSGAAAALALSLLGSGGCSPGASLDRLRRDYVAQAHVRAAGVEVYRPGGDFRRAQRLAQRAMELSPQSLPVVRAAAFVFTRTQAWDLSLQAFLACQQQAGVAYPYYTGTAYLYLREEEQGTRLLEEYLATSRSEEVQGKISGLELALVLNNVGYVYADAGVNLPRALELCREAVEKAPGIPTFEDSLGWAYYRLGRYEDAAFYLERAARLMSPPEAEVLYHVGAVHARQGRLILAEQELRRAVALRPRYAEAEHELRRLRWQLPAPQRA